MRNPDRVFNRNQLLDRVWGRAGVYVEERTVDVHILRLRKLLKPFGLDRAVQISEALDTDSLHPNKLITPSTHLFPICAFLGGAK